MRSSASLTHLRRSHDCDLFARRCSNSQFTGPAYLRWFSWSVMLNSTETTSTSNRLLWKFMRLKRWHWLSEFGARDVSLQIGLEHCNVGHCFCICPIAFDSLEIFDCSALTVFPGDLSPYVHSLDRWLWSCKWWAKMFFGLSSSKIQTKQKTWNQIKAQEQFVLFFFF